MLAARVSNEVPPKVLPLVDLETRAKRWRKAMADADTGPLTIAKEVVDVAEHWEQWKAQADGMGATDWLKHTFGEGKTLAFWQRRHDAVEKLGEAVRRTFNHDVAVWVAQNVPAEQHKDVVRAIMKARKDNGDNCLSVMQARRVVSTVLDYKPRQKTCAQCRERDMRILQLEEELAKARQ